MRIKKVKSKTIVVRMSPELYGVLSAYADYHGMNISEFVRLVLMEASNSVSDGLTSADRIRALFPKNNNSSTVK